MKKAGEEEEKEQEKLGKLEYTLDYNFTDAQVGPGSRHKCFIMMHTDDFNLMSNACLLPPEAHSGHPTGSGPGCYGHGGDV